jgi:four helix bundle suffix protein
MYNNKDFLPQRGNYENLAVYKLAACIYAVTYYFANTYFSPKDRTIDQMVQAARSGKQNIAEGSVDGNTSTEMEIKLMNAARGSMHELKADYEDYLTLHELERWSTNDPRTIATRRFCRNNSDPSVFIAKAKERSPETVANIALTMIHQFDYLMVRLIESIKRRFLEQGGIKEQMYKARKEHRDNQDNQ